MPERPSATGNCHGPAVSTPFLRSAGRVRTAIRRNDFLRTPAFFQWERVTSDL
jgi:hypothetical protein